MYKKLMTCLESVKKKIDFKPEVALILGSGTWRFCRWNSNRADN